MKMTGFNFLQAIGSLGTGKVQLRGNCTEWRGREVTSLKRQESTAGDTVTSAIAISQKMALPSKYLLFLGISSTFSFKI